MSRLTALGVAFAVGVLAYKVARRVDVAELAAAAREGSGSAESAD